MASKGKVTLRGRFSPGDKVELVEGDFPDPMVPDAIDTATVSDEGEVTFDELEVGQDYVVRDEARTRQARITARGPERIEDVLVPKGDLTPISEPPETPVEDVPRVVHEGPRSTRMLTSTRGDAFAGEGQGDEGRLSKPRDGDDDAPIDPYDLRQADYGGQQESDTPIGRATPVRVEEVEVEHLYADVDDPVTHARETEPVIDTELEAIPLTVEETAEEVDVEYEERTETYADPDARPVAQPEGGAGEYLEHDEDSEPEAPKQPEEPEPGQPAEAPHEKRSHHRKKPASE